jgi:hypothetical protein
MRRNIIHEKGKFFLTGITTVDQLEPSYLEPKMRTENGSYLIGDWKSENGQAEIDITGPEGFSAVVHSDGTVVVENSEWLLWCSENPEAIMGDGRACGSLDRPGTYGMAYSFPPDFYRL